MSCKLDGGGFGKRGFVMKVLQLVVWSRAIIGAAIGLVLTVLYTMLLFGTVLRLFVVAGPIVGTGVHLLLDGLMRVAAGAVTALLIRQRYAVSGRAQFVPTAFVAGVLGWLVVLGYVLVMTRYTPTASGGMLETYLSVFLWVGEFCLGAILISPKAKAVDPAASLRRGRYADAFQHRDEGAAVVEFVGVVIVVATMVLGTIATVAPSTVGTTFMQAICKAYSTVSGQSIDCGTAEGQPGDDEQADEDQTKQEQPKTDADYRPDECMTWEKNEVSSVAAHIGIIQIGEDAGFVEQWFNTNDNDPENDIVRLTVTDGAKLGVGLDTPGVTAGKSKIGAEVKFGDTIGYKYGETWEFSGRDSEGRTALEQEAAMREQLSAYLKEQKALWASRSSGAAPISGLDIGLMLWGGDDPYRHPPKDPTYTVSEFDNDVNLTVNSGLRLPGPWEGVEKAGKPGQDAIDVGGVGLAANSTEKVVKKVNRDTGEQTMTWSLSGSLEGSFGLPAFGIDKSGSAEGAFTVVSDASGNVTSISFATTMEGSDGVHGTAGGETTVGKGGGEASGSVDASASRSTSTVVTTTLDLTKLSAADQATVLQWTASRLALGLGAGIPPGVTIPANPSEDAFGSIMYHNATTSELTYDNIKDKFEFDLAVKMGWKLGLGTLIDKTTATLTDAKYLGRPDGTSARVWIPDPECAG